MDIFRKELCFEFICVKCGGQLTINKNETCSTGTSSTCKIHLNPCFKCEEKINEIKKAIIVLKEF